MATKPINVDAFEIKTLLIDKCAGIAAYLQNVATPIYIDTVGIDAMIKRASELNLALKEAVAAMPEPGNMPSVGANKQN